jgi:6-phosphogluconolactonase
MTLRLVVSNALDGTLHVLGFDTSRAAFETLQILDLGGRLMPIAASPDGRFLYVARRSEPFASVTLQRAGDRLEVAGEAMLPGSMVYLTVDARGRFLLAASYSGDVLSVSAIASDRLARAAHQLLPTARHPHAIVLDPTNRFALAPCLGGGHVIQLLFDADRGMLSPNEPPVWPQRPGAGPRHLAFHPVLRVVYLLNELDATLDVLAFDTIDGTLSHRQTLSTLPAGFDGRRWAADVHVTPDGRYVYSSDRGSNTLAMFETDPDGRLRLLGHVDTEPQPRGFAIEPGGRFLFAAGEASHRVVAYSIDILSGMLTEIAHHVAGLGPNWIVPLSPSASP